MAQQLTSGQYQYYEFDVDFSVTQIDKIEVHFINDYYGNGQDRNLYIRAITIENQLNGDSKHYDYQDENFNLIRSGQLLEKPNMLPIIPWDVGHVELSL